MNASSGPVPIAPAVLEAIPHGLRYRLADVLRLLGDEPSDLLFERLRRLQAEGAGWLGAAPGLADVGYWMIEPARAAEVRRRGCIWLTLFPGEDTARRLATVACDPSAPLPVRDQAVWSLGYRQARTAHPSVRWSDAAVAIADDALIAIAATETARGAITLEQLPLALRHVDHAGLDRLIAAAPALWGEAIECFLGADAARAVWARFADLGDGHRLRAMRAVTAALGAEAIPLLRAGAAEVSVDERLERHCLALSVGGEAELGPLEDELRPLQYADTWRQRARWHLAHPGVIPTVRGLRVARTTARLAAADRAAACAGAADDLGALTAFARHPEHYLYTMWGWMVRGAGDPARARALVSAHPESQKLVRDLYLRDLASRGRVKQLTAAAQSLAGADVGAFWLAVHGRPLAALELAATARLQTPELVAARALGAYRAGRADLAARVLAEDLPPSEIVDDDALPPFPGPHERWLTERAPDERPALTALVRGRDALLALAEPAPAGAEPDTASLDATAALLRRLGRGLPGSTVYLAGEFQHMDRGAIERGVEAAGARLVNGPFPGTDYYVHGDWCVVTTIAQLERQGARRLRHADLEVIP